MHNLLVLLVAFSPGAAQADAAQLPAKEKEPAFVAEFAKVKEKSNALLSLINKEILSLTGKEREAALPKLMERWQNQSKPLAKKALQVVQPHARQKAAVEPLTWILNNFPTASEANKAADLLIKYHLKDPRTLSTGARFTGMPVAWGEKLLRALAKADLPREKKGQALLNLAQLVQSKAEMPRMFKDIDANMLKTVEARFGKDFVSKMRKLDSAKLEAEAIRLYEEVSKKYGNVKNGLGTLGESADSAIYALKYLSIGKTAPEIVGEDIDGKKFKLSDYRGKVVVLDFWGNW